MTDDEAARVLAGLPGLVNGDGALVRRGRFLSADFLVGAGRAAVLIAVRDGRIAGAARDPPPMRSWRFAIRAEAEAWERFWRPTPPPGYHDLLAMTRFGTARIDGDLQPLMANLRYVKEVLAAPRRAAGGPGDGG